MFGWYHRWRQARRLAGRGLFRYVDGYGHAVYGDPFRIWRELSNHPQLNLEAMADEIDQGAHEETTIAVNAVCDVFHVHRWNGTDGLTDEELLRLLASMIDWLNAVKKNSSPGLTSSLPMASASSKAPAVPAEPTNPPSDSGSTATASTPARPSASSVPSAPELSPN